jgi:hypothetical protein
VHGPGYFNLPIEASKEEYHPLQYVDEWSENEREYCPTLKQKRE